MGVWIIQLHAVNVVDVGGWLDAPSDSPHVCRKQRAMALGPTRVWACLHKVGVVELEAQLGLCFSHGY